MCRVSVHTGLVAYPDGSDSVSSITVLGDHCCKRGSSLSHMFAAQDCNFSKEAGREGRKAGMFTVVYRNCSQFPF